MVTRFKNGNYNIKLDNYKDIKEGHELETILFELYDHEFYISGEQGCASDFDMYISFYNHCTGLEYLLLFSDIEKLKTGKTIKLIGRSVNEEELQAINEFMEG